MVPLCEGSKVIEPPKQIIEVGNKNLYSIDLFLTLLVTLAYLFMFAIKIFFGIKNRSFREIPTFDPSSQYVVFLMPRLSARYYSGDDERKSD